MSKLQARRLEEREKRRQDILAAARKLFAEKGFKATTAGDIADEVRLSRSLLYTYFKDLDHLLCAVALQGLTDLRQEFLEALKVEQPGLESMETLGWTYIRFALRRRDQYQAIAAFQAHGPFDPFAAPEGAKGLGEQFAIDLGRLEGISQEITTTMALEVARGVRDGSIRADVGDPLLVSLSLWAQTGGLIQFALLQEGRAPAEHPLDQEAFLASGMELLRRALERRAQPWP